MEIYETGEILIPTCRIMRNSDCATNRENANPYVSREHDETSSTAFLREPTCFENRRSEAEDWTSNATAHPSMMPNLLTHSLSSTSRPSTRAIHMNVEKKDAKQNKKTSETFTPHTTSGVNTIRPGSLIQRRQNGSMLMFEAYDEGCFNGGDKRSEQLEKLLHTRHDRFSALFPGIGGGAGGGKFLRERGKSVQSLFGRHSARVHATLSKVSNHQYGISNRTTGRTLSVDSVDSTQHIIRRPVQAFDNNNPDVANKYKINPDGQLFNMSYSSQQSEENGNHRFSMNGRRNRGSVLRSVIEEEEEEGGPQLSNEKESSSIDGITKKINTADKKSPKHSVRFGSVYSNASDIQYGRQRGSMDSVTDMFKRNSTNGIASTSWDMFSDHGNRIDRTSNVSQRSNCIPRSTRLPYFRVGANIGLDPCLLAFEMLDHYRMEFNKLACQQLFNAGKMVSAVSLSRTERNSVLRNERFSTIRRNLREETMDSANFSKILSQQAENKAAEKMSVRYQNLDLILDVMLCSKYISS